MTTLSPPGCCLETSTSVLTTTPSPSQLCHLCPPSPRCPRLRAHPHEFPLARQCPAFHLLRASALRSSHPCPALQEDTMPTLRCQHLFSGRKSGACFSQSVRSKWKRVMNKDYHLLSSARTERLSGFQHMARPASGASTRTGSAGLPSMAPALSPAGTTVATDHRELFSDWLSLCPVQYSRLCSCVPGLLGWEEPAGPFGRRFGGPPSSFLIVLESGSASYSLD